MHAAIVLLAIGVAGSSAYQTTAEERLRPGESMAVGDYTLAYRGLEQRRGENAVQTRALIDVSRDGEPLGTLEPGKNEYEVEAFFSTEVAVRADWRSGGDLYVVADEIYRDGAVYFEAYVKPLVNLIWLAGLVFLAGSLIALWPDAREQRRLALRYDAAAAPDEA